MEYDQIRKELLLEIAISKEALNKNDSQGLRRSYCRSVMCFIEAISSWMCKYTIEMNYPGVLGDSEKKKLEITNNAIEKLYHALDFYADLNGAISPFLRGSEEWSVLKNAIIIRNRITHPKMSSDIWISDRDMKCMHNAFHIMEVFVSEVFNRSTQALKKRHDEI